VVAAPRSERTIAFRGANAQLWRTRAPRVLIDGPRGTGKTTSVLTLADSLLEQYAIRAVFVRNHRSEFAGTILPQWEDEVLGRDHPAVLNYGGKTRGGREWYKGWRTGSEVQLLGLDDGGKSLSGEYDLAVFFQAERMAEAQLADVLASVRRGRLPWGSMSIFDANPSHPGHFLLRWAKEGMPRLQSRIRDNPRAYDGKGNELPWGRDYLAECRRIYTGPQLRRMVNGEWCGDEGLVIDCWDPEVHEVPMIERAGVESYVASVDWGFGGIGSLGVWALRRLGRDTLAAYRVAEVYRRGQTLAFWTEWILRLQREYGFMRVVADSADKAAIEVVNDALARQAGQPNARFVEPIWKGRNSVELGYDLMRQKVAEGALYCCHKITRDVDPELALTSQPTGFASEIAQLCWFKDRLGVVHRDRPDPTKPDHAMDDARYFVEWLWGAQAQHEPHAPIVVGPYRTEPNIVPQADGSFRVEHVEKQVILEGWEDR
jgi:DNA polymerase III delta prime subunit